MLSYLKFKAPAFHSITDLVKSIPDNASQDEGTWLIHLVGAIRPLNKEPHSAATARLSQVIQALRTSPETLTKARKYLGYHLETRNHVRLYTDEGVSVRASFFSEAINRIGEKILPPISDPTQLSDFLDECFSEQSDYLWVKAIPNAMWIELWQLLNSKNDLTSSGVFELSITQAILVLSHRISAMGLEPDIISRMPPIEHVASPFISLDTEIGNYIELFSDRLIKSETATDDILSQQYQKALSAFVTCIECLERIRENQAALGVSLNLVYLLYRIHRAMERLKNLMRLISPIDQSNRISLGLVLFKELIRALNLRRNLKEHFSENTSLLAYKVAEHTSSAGEHYITTTRNEYWDFTISAMGGGFIIAFTNWVKFLIAYLNPAPLAGGILYSINYAGSFLTMHAFHFTLATKQPAMTASALARSLDSKGTQDHNLENAADLISKISRSQFASFLGNLIVVFPLAFALSWIWYFLSGVHIASEEKALSTIASFNPFTTFTIPYAALTGIILYLGSFMSGFCDNYVAYARVYERIKKHRFWRKYISEAWLNKIGEYVEHNLGAIVGNLFLGFALGLTPMIGIITGLPLDVRHVTIAAGGSAIAFAQVWNQLSVLEVFVTLFGVFCVGTVNFLVSFGLSLIIAIGSRRVNFTESRSLIRLVYKRFTENPSHFILPPKSV